MNRRCLNEVNIHKVLENTGYKLGKTIGHGTYSKVCVVTDVHHKPSACKIINKKYTGSDFTKKFLPRELKIVSRIRHPNIVNVFKIFEIHNVIYMLMDYCSNGDLLEYIRFHGSLSEEKAKHYFRQIVSAISYLHNIHVAHRDIKCENILINHSDAIKLGDFGFARVCQNKNEKILSNTFCGSAAYAAPEILQGIPYDPKMFDIWALGCVLYVMLTAAMPFDDSNIKKMIKKQLSRTLITQTHSIKLKNSSELRNLLTHLLEPDIIKRPTIKQVANCLWLQQSLLKRYKNILLSISDHWL